MTFASATNRIPFTESSPEKQLQDRNDTIDVEEGSDSAGSGGSSKVRSRVKGRTSPNDFTGNYEDMTDKLPLLRSDSFGSDDSPLPPTIESSSSLGKLRLMGSWVKVLALSAVLGHLLYNLSGLVLETFYFPSYGYMLPGHLKRIAITPSLDYQRPEGLEPTVHIPRIVHVTYKSREQLPPEWKESLAEWERVHPDWEIRFWSDADIYKFVHEQYPDLEELHQSYKYMIQRVDSVRYMILYHYGGVYSDLDIYPATALDKLLEQWEDAGKSILLAESHNMGVTNAFMAAAPQSEFMQCALDNLANYQHAYHHVATMQWQHWEILSSAGSTFIWGMVGHCWQARHEVQILDADAFRGCSVCKGQDSCDTEWLHHSSTNSSWHVHSSPFHALMFFVTYSYLCHPQRACFITVLILLCVARKKKNMKRVIITK